MDNKTNNKKNDNHRKQKIRKINFVDVNVLKYYRFMFNGKNLQLNFGEENDENENIEKVLIWKELMKTQQIPKHMKMQQTI